MAVVRKKQDDKNLKILREIVTVGGGNRQCFDCGQKGPTYVNMTIGSFVCTRCSGILRGLTPPHRVKSISMATFTPEEIEFLKSNGNDACAKTWLGLWDPKRIVQQDQRELMVDKYERKRYYLEPGSPLKSLTNNATKYCNSNSNSSSNNNNNNNNNNNSLINNNNNNNNLISNVVNNNSNNLINHKNSIDNSFKNINLTPPTSRSHSSNGSVNSSNVSSNGNSNLKQNGFNGFRNDDIGTQMNGGFNNGHLNGTSRPVPANKSNLNLSTSSAANSETSSCHSNGFTPDSDFVADFSSANIFDATSVNPLNAFGTMAGHHHHQNGFTGSSANGVAVVNGGTSNKIQNGSNFPMNTGSDNFADFDHAPIYNAAGLPMSNSTTNNSLSSNGTLNSNSTTNSSALPSADRYAALKDLDEQLRESKAVAAQAAAVVAATVVDSFGNGPLNGTANPNPFKQNGTIANRQPVVNPFQTAAVSPPAIFNTTPTVFPTNVVVNNNQQNGTTNGSYAMMNLNQTNPYDFINNFNTNLMTSPQNNIIPNGPNGCGFGFGTIQQQISTGGSNYNNPFAATGTLNTNNPFL